MAELLPASCTVCHVDEALLAVQGRDNKVRLSRSGEVTRAEIQRSVSLGCICCNLFQTGFDFIERSYGPSSRNRRLTVACGRIHGSKTADVKEGDLWIMLCFELYLMGDMVKFEIYEPSRDVLPWLKGARSKRKDVPHHASDPSCFRLLKSWLEVCDQEHNDDCARPSPLPAATDSKPARLLHIQVDEENTVVRVKLVDTPVQIGFRYCALSYCWGNAKFVTSTTETYKSHYRDGIAVEKLPRTYQDAIYVAHSIGVHYIWIDSLCIIQGYASDWETEITKMAAIFEGSYLTIAAGSASNAHAGFLNDRLVQGRVLTEFRTEKSEASPRVKFLLRKPIEHSASPDEANLHPMRRRGWCLQELTLSKRVIFYNASELVWKCRRASSCECGELDYKDQEPPLTANSQRKIEDEERRHFGKNWLDTIREYMTMQLTDQSDIFPAIEGLARRMHYDRLGRYLAGLWEADIMHGLLWGPQNKSIRRPSSYQAPSWSWASVIGPVSWSFDTYSAVSASTPVASMCHVKIIPTNPRDMLGRLRGGSITLRGALIKGTFEWSRLFRELPLYARKETGDFFAFLRLDDGEAVQNVDLDYLQDGNYDRWNAVTGTEFYSLRLLTRPLNRSEGEGLTSYGLLLRKVQSEPRLYRRVGWHGMSPNYLYEAVGEQEVKIA